MELVKVCIPIYKSNPTPSEKVSFCQCLTILGRHKISIFTYRELDITYYEDTFKRYLTDYEVMIFDKSYFADISGYNKLLLSPCFYKKYLKSKYILIYQLDAYVFRDELLEWCNKGYTYVGAPWVKITANGACFSGVGNGGFSLRHVAQHLRVLKSFAYIQSPKKLLGKYLYSKKALKAPLGSLWSFIKNLTIQNNTFYVMNDFSSNEDYFWSAVAGSKFKWFKIPSAEEASKFSFELEPSFLFYQNNSSLPFGCHAWEKYEPDFWRRYIVE